MVAYLEKSEGSEGFHQIIDFLSASHIKYTLAENPTIYASLIEQFWQTAALSTIEDGVMAITATIDRNVKVLITEASNRRHLKLGDSEGLSTLPTKEIFQQSALINMKRASKGYSRVITSLFDTMLVQHEHGEPSTPESSPSKETTPMPMTHLSKVFTHLDVMMANKVYSSALTKLILRVKKLERTVKTSKARRKARIVISEDEDAEDPSKHRSLIEELDMDVDISLVPPHAADQGRKSDDTQVSGQPEDQLGVFSAAKVLADAAEQERSVGNAKDKGKAVMQESEPTKKIKKRIQVQMSIDEELARKLHKEEPARFNAEQEASDIARKEKVVAEGGFKLSHFKRMSYEDIRHIFEKVWDQIHSFVPINSELEVQRSKRTVQEVERQSTEEEKGKKSDDSRKPTRKKTLARKRARGNDSQKSVKKQKLEDDTEKKELKAYLDIVPEDEIVMEVESLATNGIHILLMDNGIAIHMLIEKKYPLGQNMISKMLNKRLEVEQESEMAFELLRFIRSQVQKQ
nr:xylulose kinase-1 [Tanacetum cinerariifolium]